MCIQYDALLERDAHKKNRFERYSRSGAANTCLLYIGDRVNEHDDFADTRAFRSYSREPLVSRLFVSHERSNERSNAPSRTPVTFL